MQVMSIWCKSGGAVALAVALAIGAAGCNKQSDDTVLAQQQDPNYDPASANMAPADQSAAAPANESTAPVNSAGSAQAAPAPQYPSQTAPSASEDVPPPPPDQSASTYYPEDDTVPSADVNPDQGGYYDDSAVEQPVYAPEPPPALPVYAQPYCPGPNYIWTPGYWAYQPVGYYWVPGVWVIAPYIGALWTPGYWGWFGNHYLWNHGYWGPHIGYYGGIDYGHGYFGRGYEGGYWNRNNFYYNRSITNVNTTVIKNVYVRNVTINNYNNNYTRVSYNGGRGGIQARPTGAELEASRERHLPPLTAQTAHMRQAGQDRAQFFSANQGRPQTVAMNRPLATPFRSPAAQPPARGVANPGFRERPALIRPENRNPMPQQRPETSQAHPNLIRPQAHPQYQPAPVERQQTRPAPVQREQMRPQPQRDQARPQPEQTPQMQREQMRVPQPVQRPQMQREQARPQPEQRPQFQREQARSQPPQFQREQSRPEFQPRAQQEKPRAAIERQQSQPRPEARPQPQQSHGGRGHSR